MTKPHLIHVGPEQHAPAPERTPQTQQEEPGRQPSETPVQYARRRFGRQFAHEKGASFEWNSGPTILTPDVQAAMRSENEKLRERK